ncbi:hypothetical protein C2869_19270 [Saccharobesus litoralis]|uniref:Uncharacterized protein n=1 Tax=Saccharobesus litoralis TaxID=2172099 RepID=A0A2S0VW17_9ALTE|nr:hypothetical protein [Saccharobesus litoralis]AWB68414.1 hypothetical protein C2869_19270 [Saccharobesus litoralis]
MVYRTLSAVLLTLLFPGLIHANGLDDLRKQLALLQGLTPVTAYIEASYQRERDEFTTEGSTQLTVQSNEHGFSLHYAPTITASLRQEMAVNTDDVDNPAQKRPTMTAIKSNSEVDYFQMLSAATGLLQTLKHATLIEETVTEYQGKPARLLDLALPVEAIIHDKKFRSYVKSFDASYQVWMTEQGVPLEAKMQFSGHGRAYLLFSLEGSGANTERFQLVNDRLVQTYTEGHFSSSSIFGDFTNQRIRKLVIQ